MFDQTCFNRLATRFNISSMFGHQTAMFDDVWSPNISSLDRRKAFRKDLKKVLSTKSRFGS